MNRIAFIIGEKFLYWNAIMLALGAVIAICMFLALSVRNREDRFPAVVAIPLGMCLSLVFSRLVHWYCRPQGYEGMLSALTDYSRGSFALIGVFGGCLLTALLLRLFRVSRNLPRMLDAMSLAGCLGISVGRLSALFSTADRGMVVPSWVPFPLASRLTNSVSGETEVRLAVFMLQAILAGILFTCLLIFYLRGKKHSTLRDGDTCLVFLLVYCASQTVLDSPRYDSLYFRSNGFVSVVQIFGLLTVILTLTWFTVRLFRTGNWKKVWMSLLTLPLLGGAGYMEYHVQRHGGEALFAYSVMSLCMLLVVILGLCIRSGAVRQEPVLQDPCDPYDSYRMPPQPRERAPQKRHSGRYQGRFAAKK